MEHQMISEMNQFGYLKNLQGFENVVAQEECCGIDFYASEIVEGDSIVIDKENFEEIILKENLKRYLIEKCHFLYKAGIFVDVERSEIIMESDLEKYLHEEHGFHFAIAE